MKENLTVTLLKSGKSGVCNSPWQILLVNALLRMLYHQQEGNLELKKVSRGFKAPFSMLENAC